MEEYMDNSVQSIFKKLVKEKNFGEVVLVGWAYTEYIVDLIVRKELDTVEKKGQHKELLYKGEIARSRFMLKFKFVRTCDIFTHEEVEKIIRFQRQRNRMFHKDLFNKLEYYSEEGRKTLMNSANDAFWAVYTGFERKYIRGANFS